MAIAEFKDELDNLPDLPKGEQPSQEASAAATAPAQTATPSAAAKTYTVADDEDEKADMKKGSTSPADEDLGVDFGDSELMKRGDGLDRVRPSEKGKRVRFAILGQFIKAQMSYTHYIEKKGTFRCLVDATKRLHRDKGGDPNAQGYCCLKLREDSEPTIVCLVLHYTNADPVTGKYEPGTPIEWDIKYVQLTKANYQAIYALTQEDDKDVYSIDIVMQHSNRAFGYEFGRMSKCKWQQNPEFAAEVAERVKPFLDGKKLRKKLGKPVTDLEMKAVIASLQQGSEDAQLGNIENL